MSEKLMRATLRKIEDLLEVLDRKERGDFSVLPLEQPARRRVIRWTEGVLRQYPNEEILRNILKVAEEGTAEEIREVLAKGETR